MDRPQPNEFLERSIDKQRVITLPRGAERAINDWITSFPSSPSSNVDSMDRSKPLPPIPSNSNMMKGNPHYMPTMERRPSEMSCPSLRSDSICSSERRPSEISCLSLMSDMFSSIEEVEVEVEDYERRSLEGLGWDAYWSPNKCVSKTPPPPSGLQIQIPKRPSPKTQLSHENRNFASSDLYGLKNASVPSEIHRPVTPRSSPSTRKTRDRSQTLVLPPVPSQSYLPDKTVAIPSRPSRPLRKTTSIPNKNNSSSRPSSQISSCTTLHSRSQSPLSCPGSPLYMICSPSTPSFAPSMDALPPLDLNNEISYFSDDDEPRTAKLTKTLKARRGVDEKESPTNSEKESKERQKNSRRLRRSLEDVNETLKSVFRRNK